MKKFIPKFLKYPLITLYIFFRCLIRGSAPKERPILNMAGVLPPEGSNEIIHGGKVKLIHLRERFGDTWRNFNIAYFVSSGLPFAPSIWIRLYKLFGIKVVWNQNGLAYPALYPNKTVARVNNLMKPIHQSDFVIYQTEFTKKCADEFLGKFSGPSRILINPVDTKIFKPRETTLPQESLMILMLGNHFESEERMTVSIEALRILKAEGVNLKLIIIGHSEHKFSEDWIEQHGAYLQKDAPTLFQSAHIFLHLKYLDPCPTAVLEALASGMPVIGSRSGGMPELVSDTSGILIPIEESFEKLHYPSPQNVASAVKTVRDNLDDFSREARISAVERFDKEIWLQKHEEIFNKLLT